MKKKWGWLIGLIEQAICNMEKAFEKYAINKEFDRILEKTGRDSQGSGADY